MTIESVIRYAREFVDEVRAIPRQLDNIREALNEYDPAGWRIHANDLEQQLKAERAEHAVTLERFRGSLVGLGLQEPSITRWMTGDEVDGDYLTSRDHDFIDECSRRQEAEWELASALETIDALTRWRKQSEKPCPALHSIRVECSKDSKEVSGVCRACNLQLSDYWRFTAESWAEFRKTKEGDT
jgi:hypothetical protein